LGEAHDNSVGGRCSTSEKTQEIVTAKDAEYAEGRKPELTKDNEENKEE